MTSKSSSSESWEEIEPINNGLHKEYVNMNGSLVSTGLNGSASASQSDPKLHKLADGGKLESSIMEKLEMSASMNARKHEYYMDKLEELEKQFGKMKMAFDEARERQSNLDFLRSLAPNIHQKLDLEIKGHPLDENGWAQLLKAIETAGLDCASIRVSDVDLPETYKYNFASRLLTMATMDSAEKGKMIKHLEFAVRGMATLEPKMLAKFEVEWVSGQRQEENLILRGVHLHGYVAELRQAEGKLTNFKMVHQDCQCGGTHHSSKMTSSVNQHSFNMDEFLFAISGGKRLLKIENLLPKLQNCDHLFQICTTKGALFDTFDLTVNVVLGSELLAELIGFWKNTNSQICHNAIRCIVLRDPGHKWDSTAFIGMPAPTQELHRECTDEGTEFIWRIDNLEAFGDECIVVKAKSLASSGTVIECTCVNAAAAIYTSTPFTVNGKVGILTKNTLTIAWLNSWKSSTKLPIFSADHVDQLIAHMHQRAELIPGQFNFHFAEQQPYKEPKFVAPSAFSLALLKEIQGINCAQSNPNAMNICCRQHTAQIYCCGRHSYGTNYEALNSCSFGSFNQNFLCCGMHSKLNPSACVSATNKAMCCKGVHQIHRYDHQHYKFRSNSGHKIQLKICIDNTTKTILCFSGTKLDG